MGLVANNRGRDNLKLQAQASARGWPKHSWNRLQMINAQTTGPERNFIESSDRKQWQESTLSRELGDAERITAASIIVKGYKMHAEMKYRIKNGGRD